MNKVSKKLRNKINKHLDYLYQENVVLSYHDSAKIYLPKLVEYIEWISQSTEEKHAFRISLLSSIRKSSGNTEDLMDLITLYETIQNAKPYIIVFEKRTQSILDFCNDIIDQIDEDQSLLYRIDFSIDEINSVFEPFFNKILPFNTNVFPECCDKIVHLHNVISKYVNPNNDCIRG